MAVPKKKTPKEKVEKKVVRKAPVKKKVAPKKMGRPSKMNAVLFEKVSNILETSKEGLDTICKREKSSASAYYDFMHKDETGKLTERYARARELQSHYFNDLIIEVAFDDKDDEKPFVGANHIQRDRVKIQALEIASKRANPSKYGDRVDVNHSGNIDIDFTE